MWLGEFLVPEEAVQIILSNKEKLNMTATYTGGPVCTVWALDVGREGT